MASEAFINIPSELEAVNATVQLWFDEGVNQTLTANDPLRMIEEVTMDLRADRGRAHVALISQDAQFSDYQTTDDGPNDAGPRPQGMVDVFRPTIHDYRYTIPEQLFYIDIPIIAIEDDAWGVYEEYTKNLARAVARRRRLLTGNKILNAASQICYTGLTFFNTAQYIDPTNPAAGTFNNYRTLPLTKQNFETLYGYMQTIPDESGNPAGNLPSILMVAPEQQSLAEEIVKAQRGQFGQDNVNMGKAQVRVNPMWSATAPLMWDLYAADGPKKPYGYATMVQPTPRFVGQAVIDTQRQYRWEVRVRDRVIFVDPRKAMRSLPS